MSEYEKITELEGLIIELQQELEEKTHTIEVLKNKLDNTLRMKRRGLTQELSPSVQALSQLSHTEEENYTDRKKDRLDRRIKDLASMIIRVYKDDLR